MKEKNIYKFVREERKKLDWLERDRESEKGKEGGGLERRRYYYGGGDVAEMEAGGSPNDTWEGVGGHPTWTESGPSNIVQLGWRKSKARSLRENPIRSFPDPGLTTWRLCIGKWKFQIFR